ncbi:MAG: enhanced serine sensitivity protein SseB, partial [Oscillospiraceae bacterium]|nr:enhanced serine sensitivity protein SseB [Oscillospiraceae bacterium]
MSSIQELISQLNSETEDVKRATLKTELVTLIKKQDFLWGAFCPNTRHYFLAQEHGQLTAYIFSEESFFENFLIELSKKHIMLNAVKNSAEHRMFLFAELYRCGVTQICINSEQEHVKIALSSLIPIPDYSSLPLVQRPVLNPTVTGKILCMMQDISFGRANGNTELDVLQEIYHSAFLLPIKPRQENVPEEAGIYQLSDGKQVFMIFTDLYSLKQANPENYSQARIARFADLKQLLASDADKIGIIINPASGAGMLLDAQLLEIAEKSASGILENIVTRNMNENAGKIVITNLESEPLEMINHVCEILKEDSLVKTAYLRHIQREEEIRTHYLMILDWNDSATKEQKSEIQKKIAKSALPYAKGLDIECISYDSAVGKEWTGNAEPFYKMQEPDNSSKSDKSDKKEKKSKGLFG